MVVLSSDLRNLLTEDSLNSIMSAGSGANGHLVPAVSDEIIPNHKIVQESSQEKEVIPEKINTDSSEIKSFVKEKIDSYDEKINCYDEKITVMTGKMNEMIKIINILESKLKDLESRPAQSSGQRVLPKENVTKNKNPRSPDALPPEISLEKIFSCNGKKFD